MRVPRLQCRSRQTVNNSFPAFSSSPFFYDRARIIWYAENGERKGEIGNVFFFSRIFLDDQIIRKIFGNINEA